MAFFLGNSLLLKKKPSSLFGAPKVPKPSGSVTKLSGSVEKQFKPKPQKIHNTLIYNSYSPSESIKASQEAIYRRFMIDPSGNVVEQPQNHLSWQFYTNPESNVSQSLQSTTLQVSVIYRAEISADVIAIHYTNPDTGIIDWRTVQYEDFHGTAKPKFYIKIFNPVTRKSDKKLYGDINYWPPQGGRLRSRSSSRSPSRSPRPGLQFTDAHQVELNRMLNSQFGKKQRSKRSKQSKQSKQSKKQFNFSLLRLKRDLKSVI